jgi:hypothetical protein
MAISAAHHGVRMKRAVPALRQIIVTFRRRRKDVEIDVRRTPTRHVAEEVLAGTLHFGVSTTHRLPAGLSCVVIAADDGSLLRRLVTCAQPHEGHGASLRMSPRMVVIDGRRR